MVSHFVFVLKYITLVRTFHNHRWSSELLEFVRVSTTKIELAK